MIPSHLPKFAPLRQSLSPDVLQLFGHCPLFAHPVIRNQGSQDSF
jgi:phenylalanine-4-hydroxylase